LVDFLNTHRPNGCPENPATKKNARVPAHTHARMRAGAKKGILVGSVSAPVALSTFGAANWHKIFAGHSRRQSAMPLGNREMQQK
jgi:hypothetical protein